MLKVARDYIELAEGKRRKVSYKDVRFDKDKWANAKSYLPADYDLVYMRLDSDITIAGWSNGNSWEGLRLRENDHVLYWKRKF